MSIELKFSRRDSPSYILASGEAEVGWLRAGLIGFCDFADSARGQRAGVIAGSIVHDWYGTRWRRHG